MSKYGCVKAGYIMVAGVDLSNHCESFTPGYGNASLPAQAMGDSQEYANPGMRTRSLTARFYNDFASGSVFATLNPLKNGSKHDVQYRHDSGAATALNPTYSGSWFITSTNGLIGGTIGGNSMVDVTWAPANAETEKTS